MAVVSILKLLTLVLFTKFPGSLFHVLVILASKKKMRCGEGLKGWRSLGRGHVGGMSTEQNTNLEAHTLTDSSRFTLA